jgi:hypothetical protein
MPFDENLAKRVRRLLGGDFALMEKRMVGGLAFMVNGHMCCGVVGEDLVVRTGPAAYHEAVSEPHARPMDFNGRPMRGFVYVGSQGYRSSSELRSWIQRGLHFVLSLPAK